MKPELCIFIDERISPADNFERYIVGGLVVERKRWAKLHTGTKRVPGMRRRRRLDAIKLLLDKTGGFGLLAYADLPTSLIPSGEIDGTDDIPQMTRRDNAWMQAVVTHAAAALACIRTSGVNAGVIDLFYDPKSLTALHRVAFEDLFRKTLTDIAREDPITHDIQEAPGLVFRDVQQVPKAYHNQPRDHLQDGIDVAHHLCSKLDELLRERTERIVVRNHTDVICRMITKFETTESLNDAT